MNMGAIYVTATSQNVAAMGAAATPWTNRGALVVMLMFGVALAVGLAIAGFYVFLHSAHTDRRAR
jgi:hypothetical protein